MKYTVMALIIFVVVAGALFFSGKIELKSIIVGGIGLVIAYVVVIGIDFTARTSSNEIWSGVVTDVYHKEEWDEWHPPRTETYTTKDSNGNTVTETRVIPGYWEHHDAENYVTTSDNGRFRVYRTPEGKRLTDYFVNSTRELEGYYPIGSPTASVHKYTNKVKSSYSLFKHKEIDLDDYPDLFKYPTKVNNYLSVDRLFGDFKDKETKNKLLDKINSNLNDTKNPNNKEGTKGYKQVNLMLVNFGDKTEDYGFAQQDYWENGAKNDLVVTFGTDSKGKPTWCYVFSWSESELLKIELRKLVMSVENINTDYEEMMTSMSKLVEEKFQRREFAEFEYIQVEPSTFSKVVLIIILGASIMYLFLDVNNGYVSRKKSYY